MQATAKWQKTLPPAIALCPTARDIVTSPDSLSIRLRHLTNNHIQHKLHLDCWSIVYDEEEALFNEPRYWLREIEWLYEQQTWVFARVIIPESTACLNQSALTNLGNTSLGDVLFQEASLNRKDFEYAQLIQTHPYYSSVLKNSGVQTQSLLARRSLFYFHKKPLLICEVFLPAFYEHLNKQHSYHEQNQTISEANSL